MHGELSAVDASLKYPDAGGAHNIRKRSEEAVTRQLFSTMQVKEVA